LLKVTLNTIKQKHIYLIADDKIQDVHVGATTVVVILNKEDTCFLRTGTRLHSLGTLHSDYWSRSSFSGKFKALFCHFYNKIQIKFVCFFFKFRLLYYMVFQYFDFDRTWWRLFKKGVVCTKLDIYVFINQKSKE
jgi:hypothetical protein